VILGQYVLGGSARGCAGSKVSEYSTPLLTGRFYLKFAIENRLRVLTTLSEHVQIYSQGFWLGTTFMLSIAFFILGCIFAAFDHPEIKTLGAFYLVSVLDRSSSLININSTNFSFFRVCDLYTFVLFRCRFVRL